jgi:hypothetical protein
VAFKEMIQMNKVFEALNDLFDLVTCQDSFEKGQKCYDTIEEALTTKSKKEQAFDVIVEKPFVCANAINYIRINKKNPVMLDYDHYCMAVNLVLKEKDYEILKEAILNED